MQTKEDKRIYLLSQEKPAKAVVRLGVPLLLLLNYLFGFDGMIWAQPITEVIMMAASVWMLSQVIRREQRTLASAA